MLIHQSLLIACAGVMVASHGICFPSRCSEECAPEATARQSPSEEWAEDDVSVLATSLVQLDTALAPKASRGGIIENLAFVKLHSVGSSTMTSILHTYCLFHQKNCFVQPLNASIAGKVIKVDELRAIEEHFAIPGELPLNIWPNHAVMSWPIFDKLIPGNFKFGFFRNPIDRLMSGLRHNDELSRALARVHQTLWLLEHNVVKGAYFCGKAAVRMSNLLTPEAARSLDFVLMTEKYDLSLMMLRRALGWSLFDMMYLHMKGDHPPEILTATGQLQELISQPWDRLNDATKAYLDFCIGSDDLAIYDYANETFTRQWEGLSKEEQKELEEETASFSELRNSLEQCCSSSPDDRYCSLIAEDNQAWHDRQHSLGLEYGTLQANQQPQSPPSPAESPCLSLVYH